MWGLVVLLCLGDSGARLETGVERDTFDRILINHFHDAEALPVFDQMLFQDWNPREGRFETQAWRLIKDGRLSGPERQHAEQQWQVRQEIERVPFDERTKFVPYWIGSKMVPKRDYATGLFVCQFRDGETDRKIICTTVSETWTQYDPELIDREFLAKEKRRDLIRTHSLTHAWDYLFK